MNSPLRSSLTRGAIIDLDRPHTSPTIKRSGKQRCNGSFCGTEVGRWGEVNLMMTIVAIAAALALSALVAGLTIRDKTARPKAYRLVFGLAFLLFFGASNKLVLPMLSSHYAMADFEAGLEKNPAFVAIRQYDPALYNELLQDMRTAISEGMTPDQLSAFIRDKAASVVQQRIGHASNES